MDINKWLYGMAGIQAVGVLGVYDPDTWLSAFQWENSEVVTGSPQGHLVVQMLATVNVGLGALAYTTATASDVAIVNGTSAKKVLCRALGLTNVLVLGVIVNSSADVPKSSLALFAVVAAGNIYYGFFF